MNKQLKQEIMDIEKYIGKKIKNFDGSDWYIVEGYQKLSESFIEKYNEKLNLYCVLKYQKLSENFKNKIILYLNKLQTAIDNIKL